MEPCIEISDLVKQYQGRIVVDHLSFQVAKGEAFGLLGHNGAGKSTTISCLLGLSKVDGGTTRILGEEAIKHRKTLFERIGVQLQESHFQNNIKVYEICEEMSSLYHDPQDYRLLLKQFQLDTFEKQYVNKLSGGERQKLSLVLTLIPKPEVIFLDELTTGLDVSARREVWNILKELKQKGLTILLTTHYMEEAEALCDRVLLLNKGKTVVSGSVDEVIQTSGCKNLEEAYLWYMEAVW